MARIKRELDTAADCRLRAATLGEIAAQGLDVFCWCNRCGHNAVLATSVLAAQLGPDYAVPEVGARLRCSGCASKDVATRPAWRGLGQVTRHAPSVTPAADDDGPAGDLETG